VYLDDDRENSVDDHALIDILVNCDDEEVVIVFNN
jgi:hypothetical protein